MKAEDLQLATDDDVAWSIFVVLRGYDRRGRRRNARVAPMDEREANTAAQRIVDHLKLSGYRVMKLPPARPI